MYWGLTALVIMNRQDALPRDEMIEFVMSCWDNEAGESVNLPYLQTITESYWRKAHLGRIPVMTHIYSIH